jgi:hypothetical protein
MTPDISCQSNPSRATRSEILKALISAGNCTGMESSTDFASVFFFLVLFDLMPPFADGFGTVQPVGTENMWMTPDHFLGRSKRNLTDVEPTLFTK